MHEVEVVAAHAERATVRVGDIFYKIDGDRARAALEARAMALAPIPTPEILWRTPPVLALRALSGEPLGRLGEPSPASAAAWVAAGAMARTLHDAPLPPWTGRSLPERTAELDDACRWLLARDVLPAEVVSRHRRIAEGAIRPFPPAFTHGDLQVGHVFVDRDEVTGVLDWSEAAPGDALYDLATLTLGHPEHLHDVLHGYAREVDVDVVRAWWSWRSLCGVRWLTEHGIDPAPEIAVLTSHP